MNERRRKLGEERSAIRELFEYGKQRAKEIGKENVFDFSIGNPSAPAPDCVKEEIIRLLNEVPSAQLHGYTSAQGDPAVREAVAEYLRKEFGAEISANHIYLSCGAAASLTVVLNAILSGGEEVVVLAPYFPEYRVFIEGAHGVCKEVMTDENFRLDLTALEKAITKNTAAVILNSPCNPTGVVYREEEIKALASLLNKKSKEFKKPVYLISDEPYRELTYGAKVPFPASYYDNTIVCYSFSKCLTLAGERIGYLAVNDRAEDADALYAACAGAGRDLGFVCAPALFQQVIKKCIGMTSDIGVYEKNRALLYGALTDMGYTAIEPDGAFYLFVKSLEPDANAFCERAKKHELLFVPSDSFGVKGYVRISYCVPTEMIQRALPAFEKLAKEYQK
ncbi:MAG: pyridoxal phosphate-dependent aminotransferase [Clostridia bacterium]|nr:pyridoxal phosphate-dependent aminotransferase [Clostridia bacterium]